MHYELYWISGSPNAWRAQLGMHFKGLDYVSHRFDPSKGEHKSDAYLAINPRGKVPALKDGNFVVCESIAILAYLDEKHPTPPLFGTTAQQKGRIWQRVLEMVHYVAGPIDEGLVLPLYRGRAAELAPDLKVRAGELRQTLDWLNDLLKDNEYFAGDEVSAADITVLPNLMGLKRAGSRDDARKIELGLDRIEADFPELGKWYARMEKIPGYNGAYPPHWRDKS